MNSKTLSISEARKKIFEIAEDVQKPNIYYTLTDKGRPKAVVLSADEFESWVETLEVMYDFPDLAKDIQQAEKEYKRGDYITLDELLAKQGFIKAAEKVKRNGVSSRHPQKRSKRYR
ncbi:MAG TPA: type II toxin-antitoxin system Phd/YefM family antitoxin [Patescibacteria group bacterium]